MMKRSPRPGSSLSEALRLLRLGLSVIPVRWKEKKPRVAWKEFQARRATEEEVCGWYQRWPGAGVAIVCGRVSGIVVVDCDPRNGEGLTALADRLPPTATSETGGGGRHYYFSSRGARIPKLPALLPGVDLQGEASYVIAPPSLHASGGHYRWLPGFALGAVPLAPLPLIIRQLIALHRNREVEGPAGPAPLNARGLALDALPSVPMIVRH